MTPTPTDDALRATPHQVKFEVWNVGDDGRHEAPNYGAMPRDLTSALALVDWAQSPIRIRSWRERRNGRGARVVQFLSGLDAFERGYDESVLRCSDCHAVYPETHRCQKLK